MTTYTLLVEKTKAGYMTLIGPTHFAGTLSPVYYLEWNSVAKMLKRHAGFTDAALTRYHEAIEAGTPNDIVGRFSQMKMPLPLGGFPNTTRHNHLSMSKRLRVDARADIIYMTIEALRDRGLLSLLVLIRLGQTSLRLS
jgi:hypothetical protein